MDMEYVFDKGIIRIEQSEIDIYDAMPFKDMLEGHAGYEDLTIDMSMVEDLSTPAIQVIISALKTLKGLKVEGLSDGIKREISLLGVRLYD